jgi:hypothetical protein
LKLADIDRDLIIKSYTADILAVASNV